VAVGATLTGSWRLVTESPVPLSASEAKRKLVHIAVGGFAFLLRELTWPQAAALATGAFLFNLMLLPRIGGKGMWREHEHGRGYPLGILIYPLAVLALVLVFRDRLELAAAIWGVLAFGDGMASIVGQAMAGPRLPWNPRKGWAGFLAFVLFGAAGATVLMGWTLKLPPSEWASSWILGLTVPLALFCGLVESLPTTLDDNLTVPLAGAVLLPLLVQASPSALMAHPDLAKRALLGLAINAAFAGFAYWQGSIDIAGGLSAVLIGVAITVGLGVPGLLVMIAFFVLGSAATKLGYRVKAARGIAQEKGGARGWRNAWANGGVAAFLALMAALDPPRAGLYAIAYAAAVATAAADTCSSEIGKAYGRRTFLITTLRPVPPGTEGAISLEGTLGGFAGGALVASVGALGGLYSWPVAALVALAGLLGSLAESVIGTVAERNGWLDNDLLNALNTALGAAIVVAFVSW
jgi:uncharacterized protein (TIGR00297 family)